MKEKTFVTISKSECLIAYKEILQNSDSKWAASKILARNRDYGTATSLAIISVEEQIKAIVILLDGCGFHFRKVKGIEVLFKHHRLRYFLAYIIFGISVFGDELGKMLLTVKDNPEKIEGYIQEIESNPDLFFKKYIRNKLFKIIISIRKESIWFSKIDIFRQDGFYSDYETTLKNPITISKDDYIQVAKRLDKVRRFGQMLMNAFLDNGESLNEHIKKMQTDFIKKGFYTNIGESITKMNKAKTNPFDLFKRK